MPIIKQGTNKGTFIVVALEIQWFIEFSKSDNLTLQEFEDSIGYVLQQLSASGRHVRLVFLIDEIDDALDKSWTEALFNQLRALVYIRV